MRKLYRRFRVLLIPVAMLAAGLTAWACASDSTGPGTGTRPPGIGGLAPNFELNCQGVPNGGITLIYMDPVRSTIHYVYTPHQDTIYAAVYRDDPNTPGEQVYCRDFNAAVTWTTHFYNQSHDWYLANIHAQDVTVVSSGINSGPVGSEWVVGTAGSKTDTTQVVSGF